MKLRIRSFIYVRMQRHELTIEQKIFLIEDNYSSIGLSTRKLAEKYEISKISVTKILTHSVEYHDSADT